MEEKELDGGMKKTEKQKDLRKKKIEIGRKER